MADRFSYDMDTQLLTVGDRRFPARVLGKFDDLPGGHSHRRVRVMLENGYQISVIWGSCTYSDNYDHSIHRPQEFVEEPERVECAVMDPSDDMLDVGEAGGEYMDNVVGYCTPTDVQRLILAVSELSTSEVPQFVSFTKEKVDG